MSIASPGTTLISSIVSFHGDHAGMQKVMCPPRVKQVAVNCETSEETRNSQSMEEYQMEKVASRGKVCNVQIDSPTCPINCAPVGITSSQNDICYPTIPEQSKTQNGTIKSRKQVARNQATQLFSTISQSPGATEQNFREQNDNVRYMQRHACKHKNCGKSFTTSAHLTRHFKLHTGQKPHKCPLPGCKKSFARRDNMLVHCRTHAKRVGVNLEMLSGLQCNRYAEISQNCQCLPESNHMGDLISSEHTEKMLPFYLPQKDNENFSVENSIRQFGDIGIHNQCSNIPLTSARAVLSRNTRPAGLHHVMLSPDVDSTVPSANADTKQPVSGSTDQAYNELIFQSLQRRDPRMMHDIKAQFKTSDDGNLFKSYSPEQMCPNKFEEFHRQRSQSETAILCTKLNTNHLAMCASMHSQLQYQRMDGIYPNQKKFSSPRDISVQRRFTEPDAQVFYPQESPQSTPVLSADPSLNYSAVPIVMESLTGGHEAASIPGSHPFYYRYTRQNNFKDPKIPPSSPKCNLSYATTKDISV